MALDTDSDVAAVTAAVTAPLQALRALVDEVVAVAARGCRCPRR